MTHHVPNSRLHKPRLLKWMQLVELSNMDPKIMYNKKRICHLHFSNDCFSPGTNRLNTNAYPTLNMPTGITVYFIFLCVRMFINIVHY